MPPARLTAAKLADHLVLESPATRRTIRALRAAVLKAAPTAAEAIRFHVLCYFRADAWFGSIGGNICMIERPRREGRPVVLSFIHGAHLKDPDGVPRGRSKFKRFTPIPGPEAAADPRFTARVRAAAKLRPWD